jgi:putative phage-type endonuclease
MVKPESAPVEHPYIGGGNVAGILGVSPYKTPFAEYLNITEGRPAATTEKEAFYARRKALEPWAADLFQQSTGLRILNRNQRYADREFAFIRAEIDFETEDGCNGEIKTVHPLAARDWGEPGEDACPVYVTAQAMHGLMVTGRKACYVQALIGFDDDRVYRIARDDETIAAMRDKELEFWRRVQDRQAPDPTHSSDILRMFLRDAGRSVEADDEISAVYHSLVAIQKKLAPLEAEEEACKEQIKLFLRDAAILTIEDKPAITWKSQDSKRFDQSAFSAAHPDLFAQFKATSTTRVFRIK